MNTIDLQIQSTASDGKYSPAELVKMAHDAKLETISITDHDTVDGIWEAVKAGKEFGVKVIPGIELSCAFMEREFHVLGFGVDYHHQELLARLKEFQEARKQKTEKIVKKLQEAGFYITFEDVLRYATGSTIARPAIAEAVLKNSENKELLGGITTIHEFINTYLVTGKPTYVDRRPVEVKDAIELLHRAGGVAVWSHPAIHFNGDYKKLEEILKIFIAYDIDGLECFHPDYSEDDTEFLNVLAGKYGILRTAGSDFHRNDEAGKKEGAPELAYYQTFDFSLDDIVPNLERSMLKQKTRAERVMSD